MLNGPSQPCDLMFDTGKLFTAMHSVDGDKLIKFVFPAERLPSHTQLLLASEAGRAQLETWPQYSCSIVLDHLSTKPQVHLDVFRCQPNPIFEP